MAEIRRRTQNTKRVEWLVPAPSPHGAAWTTVQKALIAARNELVAAQQIPHSDDPADEQIRYRVGDDLIIVSVDIDEPDELSDPPW